MRLVAYALQAFHPHPPSRSLRGTGCGVGSFRPPKRKPPHPVDGHFAGSEGDDFTFAIEDILEAHREDELDEAARRLAAFAPERSLLECMPERESSLNADYRGSLSGDLDPSAEGIRNEIQQLGFRVAAESGHDEVGCVDAPGLWLGDQGRLVGEWYKRNLRIFANILNEVGPDTKRVFVMMGAGHVWTLRHFLRGHRGFEGVPVGAILR